MILEGQNSGLQMGIESAEAQIFKEGHGDSFDVLKAALAVVQKGVA